MELISGERTGLRQDQARAWFRTQEPASQARVLDHSQQQSEFERLSGCLGGSMSNDAMLAGNVHDAERLGGQPITSVRRRAEGIP
jgi:hypothetical protein